MRMLPGVPVVGRLEAELGTLRVTGARDKSLLDEKSAQCEKLHAQLDAVIERFLNKMG